MPAKKNTHLLHARINELLDQILERENRSTQPQNPVERTDIDHDQSVINLGDSHQQLRVSMESFFEFNFDISEELDDFLEEKLMDSYQSQWAAEYESEGKRQLSADGKGDVAVSRGLWHKHPK